MDPSGILGDGLRQAMGGLVGGLVGALVATTVTLVSAHVGLVERHDDSSAAVSGDNTSVLRGQLTVMTLNP